MRLRFRVPSDFLIFFSAQTVSTLGSSLTQFALPLIVYSRTGSAVALGATTAFTFLPFLVLGLPAGAIADRVNRKHLMILADSVRAVGIGSLGVLFLANHARLATVYAIAFLQTAMRILFDASRFAAVVRLVDKSRLVSANGQLQASNSTMTVVGPFLGAALLGILPAPTLLIVDGVTFLASAVLLGRIRRPFNADVRNSPGTGLLLGLRRDVAEGLRYVWRHRVLRSVSIMMFVVNLIKQPVYSQFVLFATVRLYATGQRVALLYTAASIGVVLISLAAGRLRRRFSFGQVALGALVCDGLLTAVLGLSRSYYLALLLWAATSGLAVLFNINTNSLRQAISPDEMLGRVMTVSMVLAWAAVPVASMLGGLAVAATGRVDVVFVILGVASAATALAFTRSPIGRSNQQQSAISGVQ